MALDRFRSRHLGGSGAIARALGLSKPWGLGSFGPGSHFGRPRIVKGCGSIHIGARCFIGGYCWIEAFTEYYGQTFSPRIEIRDDVSFGRFACITAVDRITIGSGTLVSEHFYVSDHSHGFDPLGGPPRRQPLLPGGAVTVGEQCFIGYRVSILPGVSLGANCVVGAHSVVTRSFPARSMVAGAPARMIRRYSDSERRWIPATQAGGRE